MPKGRSHKQMRDAQDQVRLLNRNIEKLNETLSSLLDSLKTSLSTHGGKAPSGPEHLDAERLLSLPEHLRRTAMGIAKLGEGSADAVSGETGRVRAAESDYLNQLVAMGYLRKKRIGRRIVFSVVK